MKLVCCRCQKRFYDYTMLEVNALESDIKTTEFTRCEAAGDRIIVCSGCATEAELEEGNYLDFAPELPEDEEYNG